jgi:hypothetical protein
MLYFTDKNVLVLTHEVKIIVPSTKEVNLAVSNAEMVNYVATELSILNGGATITHGEGCWNSDKLGLIKEGVSIVSSKCDDLTSAVLEKIYQIGLKILVEMSQESVAVEIDGTLVLIFPEAEVEAK